MGIKVSDFKKPFKKTVTYTKEVEYWDCGKGHNHTTELIALKCHKKEITKLLNPSLVMSVEDRQKRNRKILWKWIRGTKTSDLCKEFSLSKTTIYSIVNRFCRYAAYAEYLDRPLAPTLTPELKNALLKTKIGAESAESCLSYLAGEERKSKLPKIYFHS